MSIIMGIDPGYCTTGWVIVDTDPPERAGVPLGNRSIACGVIRTAPEVGKGYVHEDTWRRCRVLSEGLAMAEAIAEQLTYAQTQVAFPWPQTDCYVVEAPAGSQSAKAASATAMAYAICAAHTGGSPSVLVTAGQAKKAATGNVRASKAQVQAGVLVVWPELEAMALAAVGKAESKVEHIYDAAACVLAAWDTDTVRAVRGE